MSLYRAWLIVERKDGDEYTSLDKTGEVGPEPLTGWLPWDQYVYQHNLLLHGHGDANRQFLDPAEEPTTGG